MVENDDGLVKGSNLKVCTGREFNHFRHLSDWLNVLCTKLSYKLGNLKNLARPFELGDWLGALKCGKKFVVEGLSGAN